MSLECYLLNKCSCYICAMCVLFAVTGVSIRGLVCPKQFCSASGLPDFVQYPLWHILLKVLHLDTPYTHTHTGNHTHWCKHTLSS